MRRRDFLLTGAMLTTATSLWPEELLAAVAKNAAAKQPPKPTRKVVAIDAGHGGKDPGTIGVAGTYEKDITFAVARELGRRLEATGRYQPVLMRRSDVFIALPDRVALARQGQASLFLSLHADWVPNPQQRGFSVYTRGETASDSLAAALAQRENAVDRLAGVDLSRHPKQVRNILFDLMQRETTNNSSMMAQTVLDSLHPPFSYLQNPKRHANFAVLKAPEIPSILVEMGFLSNAQDERELNKRATQLKLAERLHTAVDGFFEQV